MADEKEKIDEPKTFLKFRANQKSATLEISNGEYRRTFKAEEQPFEVADAEEERLLRNSGYFVSDKEAEAEAATGEEGNGEGVKGESTTTSDAALVDSNTLAPSATKTPRAKAAPKSTDAPAE